MDTHYEPSDMEKFFAGANFLLQISLAMGAFFYFTFIVDLPPTLNILASVLGFVGFASVSITSSAYAHRNGIYTSIIEDGMKASAHSKKSKSHLAIPELKPFLIRSAIALVVFLITTAILVTIGSIIMPAVMSYIVPLTSDSEAMGRIISMMVALPFFFTGLGLIVGMYIVSPAIVDATIYKNDLIIAHLYEDEKPMTIGKFAKGAWTVVRMSLGFGIAMAVLIGIRVGLNMLDEADPPLYIFIPIVAVLIIGMLAFSWWSIKRSAKSDTEKIMAKMEADLIDHHGEESVEVQNFRTEMNEYNAMSDEERKELEKENKEDEEEKPFSVARQLFKGMPIVIIGGMLFACVASIGLMFGAKQIGLEGQALEAVGKLTFPLILIIGMFIYFWRMGKMKIDLPEEFTQMAEANDRGDYANAMDLAELARDKVDLREFGYVIGGVYLQGGDIQKAESITRESLRQIMFIDASSRNAIFLSLTLTMLGAILIEAERYEEAEDSFKQSLQQDSKNPWTLSNLAEVYLFMGQAEQALDYVERAIQANDKKPEDQKSPGAIYLMFKAWALTLMGEHEETASLMREAFERVSDNKVLQGGLHYYAGHVALARGKVTTANIAFQRAIDAVPNSIVAMQSQSMLKK